MSDAKRQSRSLKAKVDEALTELLAAAEAAIVVGKRAEKARDALRGLFRKHRKERDAGGSHAS